MGKTTKRVLNQKLGLCTRKLNLPEDDGCECLTQGSDFWSYKQHPMGRGTVRCHFPSRQISGWSRHPMWKPAWDSWYTDRGRRIAETCILWLSLSVTTSLPIPSTQTDAGRLNCPAIEKSDWKLYVGIPLRFPSVPNLKWKVPSRLNICILLLLLRKQYRIRLF